MPGRQGIFISDLKMNFKLRDFFLDFLACIVPGSIFLFAVTLLVGGLILLFSLQFFTSLTWVSENHKTIVENLLGSFSFNSWLILAFTFFAYFTGHLLYRQTPKRPDYASFLRIREKVISKKNDWVIENGKGVRSEDVQFPYSNLKEYLKSRGFKHLIKYVNWEAKSKIVKKANSDNESKEKTIKNDNTNSVDKKISETEKRSKTRINKAKIRIAFFYPESTFNLIRNEAHIRLASSMWYAARYILTISYFLMVLVLFNSTYSIVLETGYKLTILLISFGLLLIGYTCRSNAVNVMKKATDEGFDESKAKEKTKFIDSCWKWYDRMPFFCSSFILVCLSISHLFYNPDKFICSPYLITYLALVSFITIGALFAKHRIEETIHYQRVREIIYVLETAFLSKILNDDDLPDIRDLNDRKIIELRNISEIAK